jgi:hypothetical protein
LPPDTLQLEKEVVRREMQQSRLGEVMIYANIAEVRQETRIAECKKLLDAGWVLLGVYSLTTAAEPKKRKSRKEQQERNPKDTHGMYSAWLAMLLARSGSKISEIRPAWQ